MPPRVYGPIFPTGFLGPSRSVIKGHANGRRGSTRQRVCSRSASEANLLEHRGDVAEFRVVPRRASPLRLLAWGRPW